MECEYWDDAPEGAKTSSRFAALFTEVWELAKKKGFPGGVKKFLEISWKYQRPWEGADSEESAIMGLKLIKLDLELDVIGVMLKGFVDSFENETDVPAGLDELKVALTKES